MKKPKPKKKTGHGSFVVVPNIDSKPMTKISAKKAAAEKQWSVKKVAEETRKKRAYEFEKGGATGTYLVVRDKETGHMISRSPVESAKTPIRKFALDTRSGSISTKDILDAIRRK